MNNVWVYNNSFTFNDLLRKLDQEGNGFLVIVDKNNRLLGMITDGDIRRAILNKKKNVLEIINSSPITISDDMDRMEAIDYLKSIHRRQVPVVAADGSLVDIIYLEDNEISFKKNKVVIMAGGLGSRLGDLTKDTPKVMLKIGDKPILESIIKNFTDYGFNHFTLCVNYKSEVIKNYFEDGSKWGVNIEYVEEDKRMGTAGALTLLGQRPSLPFFVVNGDVLSTVDFEKVLRFHRKNNATATMCVKTIENQVPYACVEVTNQHHIKGLIEKPVYRHLINAGMYILNPETLDYIPSNEFYDMPSLFETLIERQHKAIAYSLDGYWLDIGHKADYQRANSDMKIQ